ncbi:MAG TPA: hypothetical protein VHO90_00380, partial [Bacteroidales bacterium]|nr:hypothetical protein [Bacteroidales bacterium]
SPKETYRAWVFENPGSLRFFVYLLIPNWVKQLEFPVSFVISLHWCLFFAPETSIRVFPSQKVVPETSIRVF